MHFEFVLEIGGRLIITGGLYEDLKGGGEIVQDYIFSNHDMCEFSRSSIIFVTLTGSILKLEAVSVRMIELFRSALEIGDVLSMCRKKIKKIIKSDLVLSITFL